MSGGIIEMLNKCEDVLTLRCGGYYNAYMKQSIQKARDKEEADVLKLKGVLITDQERYLIENTREQLERLAKENALLKVLNEEVERDLKEQLTSFLENKGD